MKKIYLILVLVLMIVISFNCQNSNSNNQSNNKTGLIENDKQSSTKNENITKQEEDSKVDPQFKEFLEKFSKKSLPYDENPSGKEKFNKISLKDQANYLGKSEKLSKKDFEDMADYTDFYYISNPLNTSKFHAIVYGRFEMGSTYYFLCTYNNQGKLISNIDFAAYELMGAGPQAGQEFNTKGSINENMEVTVKSSEETRKYKIDENGKISKL